MNLKRAGMTALFIAFAALGLLMAILGTGPERAYGAAFVLLMGGGGLGWFVATASRRGTGLQVAAWTTEGPRQTGFVADYSPSQQVAGGLSLVSAVTGAMLLALIPREDGSTIAPAWIVFAVGLPLLAIGAVLIANAIRGARLVMTPSGLAAESATGRTFVRWDEFAAIVVDVHEPAIQIRVADAGRVERSGLHGSTHVLAKVVTGADIVIPLRTLRTDAAHLVIALDRYAGNPGLRRLIGTADELTEITTAAAGLMHTPVGPRDGRARRPGPRLSRLSGAISLLLIGMMLGLVTVAVAWGDWTETGQLRIGTGMLVALTIGHFFAGALTLKGHRLGRWLGLGVVVVAITLAGLAVIGSKAETRAGMLVLAGIVAVHAGLVIWSVVRWDSHVSTAAPASDTSSQK